MIYLDYSATTPVDDRVLDTFVKVTRDYIGNPNSLHELGVEAKKLIDASTKQIADILRVKESEVIYTSGASEANNMAIKGICFKYKNRGKHIITTTLEHSSVLEVFKYFNIVRLLFSNGNKNSSFDSNSKLNSLYKFLLFFSSSSQFAFIKITYLTLFI